MSLNLRPRIYPRMRAFSYAWSLPVTWQRWRSHHSSCQSPNPMLHANLVMCHRSGADRSFTLREYAFSTFLTLTRWPHIRTWPVFPGECVKINFLRQGLQKLLTDIHAHRHTDRQTDRHDRNYTTPLRGWPVNVIQL